MSIKTEPIALTQTQVAKATGVTTQTVRNWEKRGLLSGRRACGGVKLYPVEQVRALAVK